MQIVYHIGANCTDEERLLKTLLNNADTFAEQGIAIPGPSKYRRLLRETIQNLKGATPAAETREILLDAILDDRQAKRMVLTNAAFICVPNRIFEDGKFYHLAGLKAAGFCDLFAGDEIEFCLGIRNPATFVPAAFATATQDEFAKFLNNIQIHSLLWSDVIRRIKEAAPQAKLTVWCNEDTPIIWSQIVREVAGVNAKTRIKGGFDLMASIMAPEGMNRFLTYIRANPPRTEAQKRRIMMAFLDKYVLEDEVEDVIDLPGWTAEIMDHLTETYDRDVETIEQMQGLRFIAP